MGQVGPAYPNSGTDKAGLGENMTAHLEYSGRVGMGWACGKKISLLPFHSPKIFRAGRVGLGLALNIYES